MFCLQCGKEFEEGYRYCPYCGSPLTQPLRENPLYLKSKKALKKTLLWSIVGAVILGLVFVAYIPLLKPSEVSLFPVEIGGKWGFGDKEAHIVIEPKFDLTNWFSEGLAAVMVGN